MKIRPFRDVDRGHLQAPGDRREGGGLRRANFSLQLGNLSLRCGNSSFPTEDREMGRDEPSRRV